MSSDWANQRFDELKKLAEDRFGLLSDAENKMLRAAITGDFAFCGPNENDDDPHNNPSSGEDWGPQREIPAELLRWLCVDKTAETYVDPQGIRIHGAKISSSLNLSFASVRFALGFRRCRFSDSIWLVSARLPSLTLSGSSTQKITADGAKFQYSLFLNDGFSATGAVSLWGAQIDGNLVCGGGVFKNPWQNGILKSGMALLAARASVKGGVHLRNGFVAEGQVSLQGAQIDGDLDCHGGTFKDPTQANVPSSGTALSAENTIVKGDTFLGDGFVAEGKVNLLGAQIDGDLNCDGASFRSMVMQRAVVKRALFWRNIKTPLEVELDLQNASAGSLADHQESWPAAGKLLLDGFTYGRIAEGPKDSKTRLKWLGQQVSFSPQPFRQLAKVLREEGDDDGARRVMYEMEKRKHQEREQRWLSRLWNPVFRWTIGYGIYPRRAVWWLLLLVALGWGIYSYGYFSGAMTPTNQETYNELHNKKRLLLHYPHFYALVYSAENSFPLVNLGQKESWAPDPNQEGLAGRLRLFRWIQVLLGWALATFFVAGVTGVARKD